LRGIRNGILPEEDEKEKTGNSPRVTVGEINEWRRVAQFDLMLRRIVKRGAIV
jgi:hypothetical protein